MSAEYLYLVFSRPVAGREEEYNAWYEDVHMQDMKRVPGVCGVTRYELSETGPDDAVLPNRYLAVYELDREPEEVLAEIAKRAGGPQMQIIEAMDRGSATKAIWKRRAP